MHRKQFIIIIIIIHPRQGATPVISAACVQIMETFTFIPQRFHDFSPLEILIWNDTKAIFWGKRSGGAVGAMIFMRGWNGEQ